MVEGVRTWAADSFVVSREILEPPKLPRSIGRYAPPEVSGEIVAPVTFMPSQLVGNAVRISHGPGPAEEFTIHRAYTLRKRGSFKRIKFRARPAQVEEMAG